MGKDKKDQDLLEEIKRKVDDISREKDSEKERPSEKEDYIEIGVNEVETDEKTSKKEKVSEKKRKKDDRIPKKLVIKRGRRKSRSFLRWLFNNREL